MISGRREVRPLPRPRTSRAERCSITSRYVSGHGPKSSASHLLGTSPRSLLAPMFERTSARFLTRGRGFESRRGFKNSPGYPNQQRTPAQTRCVAGANPVPGTNVTSRTCSVTNINGEVAGSNPAGRKPVAQWQSANTPSAKTMFVSLPHAVRVDRRHAVQETTHVRVRIPLREPIRKNAPGFSGEDALALNQSRDGSSPSPGSTRPRSFTHTETQPSSLPRSA